MHQDKRLKFTPPTFSSKWPSFPVLTAVRLVGRECLHTSGDDSLLRSIDTYVGTLSGPLTMLTAYQISGGSLCLLQYLAARESKTKDIYLRRWQVTAVTGQMAACGDLQSLKWIAEKYLPGAFLTEVVAEASSSGYLDIVKWLLQNHRDRGYWGGNKKIELYGAISNNHNELVEWLRTHVVLRPECAQLVIEQVAKSGNLEIVKWLCENFDIEIVNVVRFFNAAIENGRREVTRWFLNNRKRADLRVTLDSRIFSLGPKVHEDFTMLKFLFERGLVRDPGSVLERAARDGHLHIVKWLHEEKGVTDAGDGCFFAAENDHLEVLRYLHDKNLDTNGYSYVFDTAPYAASLETIQWLHFNTPVQATSHAMDAAAGQGNSK